MPTCSYCKGNKESSNCSATLSGNVVCGQCLSAKTALNSQKLQDYKNQLAYAERERSSQGFFETLFGSNEIGNKIRTLTSAIHEEKRAIVARNTIAEVVVTYPPDWDLRREVIIAEHGGKCSRCHVREENNLHAHHINHLSRGGSNCLDNQTHYAAIAIRVNMEIETLAILARSTITMNQHWPNEQNRSPKRLSKERKYPLDTRKAVRENIHAVESNRLHSSQKNGEMVAHRSALSVTASREIPNVSLH